MSKKKLTESPEWLDLQTHSKKMKAVHILELFRQDPGRGCRLALSMGDIYFDYSKNRVTDETVAFLLRLAERSNLKGEINRMFTGEIVNPSEKRPALHVALRNTGDSPILVEGVDVMPQVREVLKKMSQITHAVRHGKWLGYSGKKIRHIVNIGIGGSDLGPAMVTEALSHYRIGELSFHFVSNIDGADLTAVLNQVDIESTLFIVASKTFTTLETMTNAQTAKDFLLKHFQSPQAVARHFLAISTNLAATAVFGIPPENVLGFWDWVGGRYSLTSAIGLPIMIAIGFEHFQEMLAGFHAMDQHFLMAPFEQNIPVLMGLLGVWHNNFLNYETQAILPYDQHLRRFPAYLQQLDMESNGKRVDRNGQLVSYQTGPVVWGECGTNSQHAFFQLLHQGTKIVPCDFIAFLEPLHSLKEHHELLLANCFAQSQALAFGKSEADVRAEGERPEMIPFKVFPGNRPSNTILIDKLTPYALGELIAMYEHKVFTQGIIWNINSFDQWGVELGKKLAKRIIPFLRIPFETLPELDLSTVSLIKRYRDYKKIEL